MIDVSYTCTLYIITHVHVQVQQMGTKYTTVHVYVQLEYLPNFSEPSFYQFQLVKLVFYCY